MHNSQNPFHSFWMAGYECADHQNAFGNRIDLLDLTGHLPHSEEDYKGLHKINIRTVREGVRWSVIEQQPYSYNWQPVKDLIEVGKNTGIQQVWDMCHFGFPSDLTPLHPMFARRFASFCAAFVLFYRSVSPSDVLIITPINEVSFLSWLGGDVKGTSPYCTHQAWDVKYGLVKAYIEGIEAIKEIDNSVKILTTEPLIKVSAGMDNSPENIERAFIENEYQFQTLDILTGRMCPELRGRPEYIDIAGLNFYHNNQWETGTHKMIDWNYSDINFGWKHLSELVIEFYNRYNYPIIISETSHTEEYRASWIKYISEQSVNVLQQNIPLWGVCIYPIIDRPDWDFPDNWHRAGIWMVDEKSNLKRTFNAALGDAILNADNAVKKVLFEKKASSAMLLSHVQN